MASMAPSLAPSIAPTIASTVGLDPNNWIIGIVLGLTGSIMINTGNNIQALGMSNLDAVKEEDRKHKLEKRAKRHAKRLKELEDEKNGGQPIRGRTESGNFYNHFHNHTPTPVTQHTKADPNSVRSTTSFNSIEINTQTPTNNSANNNPNMTFKTQKDIMDYVDYDSSDDSPDLRSDSEIASQPINACTSKIWVVGTVIFLTGSICNFASFAYAAQSLLASLESVQFVTNIIFGKFVLGATVTRRMVLGTAVTVTGTLIAVNFSSKATLELTTAKIIDLYLNPFYIFYLIAMGCAIFGLNVIYKIYDLQKSNNTPLPSSEIIMPLVYSVWSALFGTQSVVQAKVLAELLALQSSGEEQIFEHPFTYFTIAVWLLTASVWLYRLNDALSKFDPLFIIPLLQCNFIFFAILSGGIFFKEFEAFTIGQWFGFCTGIFTMFGGLVLLTPHCADDDMDDYETRENVLINKRDEDVEKRINEILETRLLEEGVAGSASGTRSSSRASARADDAEINSIRESVNRKSNLSDSSNPTVSIRSNFTPPLPAQLSFESHEKALRNSGINPGLSSINRANSNPPEMDTLTPEGSYKPPLSSDMFRVHSLSTSDLNSPPSSHLRISGRIDAAITSNSDNSNNGSERTNANPSTTPPNRRRSYRQSSMSGKFNYVFSESLDVLTGGMSTAVINATYKPETRTNVANTVAGLSNVMFSATTSIGTEFGVGMGFMQRDTKNVKPGDKNPVRGSTSPTANIEREVGGEVNKMVTSLNRKTSLSQHTMAEGRRIGEVKEYKEAVRRASMKLAGVGSGGSSTVYPKGSGGTGSERSSSGRGKSPVNLMKRLSEIKEKNNKDGTNNNKTWSAADKGWKKRDSTGSTGSGGSGGGGGGKDDDGRSSS